ncbi:MAG: AAA family ATPase [Oscillospiraceae bacterium]|nr:AAA family ATPase [Oscillospiraceae bacterium]
MGIYLNPNHTDFYNAVKHSQIYVDKTELIQYTNSVLFGEQKYICVNRPRRFGKSMTANMLTAYYSRGCDSRELFQGLKIATHTDFEKHLNQYNVIHLNMRDYLTESENIQQLIQFIEEDLLDELQQEFSDIRMPRRKTLVKVLEQAFIQYEIPFVFIIDEWDCIFRVHKSDITSQTAYLDFLRNLLKDKSYVALAYMTGILPIKKYGEHSAINVFYEYSMTDASPIEEFTGFTEQEVQQLCKQYKMPFFETKKWYDGYCVDGVSIYNPKSVVEAMLRGKFNNYWTKTETYEALKVYIDLNQDGLRDKIIQMIAGEKVPVNPDKFQNDMTTFYSADDVLTLLVHLGYLTYDEQNRDVWIPNGEVRQEFINSIEDGGWEPVVQAIHSSEKLLQATLSGDKETVAKLIEQVHQENISILKYNDENALSCVISLAYYSAQKNYTLHREMPAGKGFADIVFEPNQNCNLPALIVELKWGHSAEEAVERIKKKDYLDCLKNYNGEVILVGINYDKEKHHTCKIERIKNDSFFDPKTDPNIANAVRKLTNVKIKK